MNTEVELQLLSIEERLDRLVYIVEQLADDGGVSDLSDNARNMITELHVDRVNRQMKTCATEIFSEVGLSPTVATGGLLSFKYTKNRYDPTMPILAKQPLIGEKFNHPGIADSGGSLEDFIDKSSEL